MLAQWAAETESIDANQRQLAIRIALAIERGRDIRAQDAELGVEVLDRAGALGFPVEAGADEPKPDDLPSLP